MITPKQLNTLMTARQRYLEGLSGPLMDAATAADLLAMLGDMALRNEVLRGENEELKRLLKSPAPGQTKA